MEIGEGRELEYDYQDFEKERAGDDKLAIRFFRKAQQDSEKTILEKRPIFKEVDYIQIMVPGDRSSIIQRPLSPSDQARFARQYEHWLKTQQETLAQGTPLEAWGILNLAQVEEFRYFGIRTIEHMAELRDDLCQKIMGATTLKQKAQKFIELAKEDAPMRKVQAELDSRDNKIAALETAVADQAKRIEELLQNQRTPKKAAA